MDELPADARDQREEYREDVGYLFGASFSLSFFFLALARSIGKLMMRGYVIIGGRSGRIFSVSPVCLFSVSRPVEREAP
jgi:hypothetical protein